MKCYVALLSVLAASLSPLSAHADWQYTKWGMSTDQVSAEIAKAGSQLIPIDLKYASDPKTNTITPFRTPYRAAGMDFLAVFRFDASGSKLMSVNLGPVQRAECPQVKSSLLETYGKVETENSTRDAAGQRYTARWKDVKAGNDLRFEHAVIMGQQLCFLEYTPIGATGKKGL